MAKNYKIQFVSLRAGTTYVLNIGGGSGTAVQLSGGAEPFTTEEDGSEDMFTNIRTQTGYFRIVDNGRDYNGNVIDATAGQDWWKDLIPATDSDRPVTLTVGNTVVWQGFMQSQTFSGQLYGNPQEREFPVACPLSVLAGEDVNIDAGIRNFAYILKVVCDTIDVKSGGVMGGDGMIHITDVYVQGGADARAWLQNKIDFQNFATADAEGEMQAKYSLYEVLEDMCRFWGWTARTSGTKLFLTCCDDSSEQTFLTLTRAQLDTLAAPSTEIDTTTGGTQSTSSVSLSDSSANHIFASTNQEDYQIQGPHKAVVKADCNEHDTIVKFAPKDIEDIYLAGSYSWVQGDGDLVGYFSTQPVINGYYSGKTLIISSNANAGFCRRQIYPTTEAENPIVGDMIMITGTGGEVTLQTKRPMSFSGGSLTLSGSVWRGAMEMSASANNYSIQMRIGIGPSRNSNQTRWWSMTRLITSRSESIVSGWVSQPTIFNVPIIGNQIKSTGCYFSVSVLLNVSCQYAYPSIPVPSGISGYLFIEITGADDPFDTGTIETFEIANFTVEYSRDTYEIPTSVDVVRPRELKQNRVTTQEYTATNSNDSLDEWNANCIFASDNNMEYGYGLLLDVSGNILSKVSYAGTLEHPEQHLADRVASYWANAKRNIYAELQANKVGDVTPQAFVSVSGEAGTFIPIAISRNWRDDVLKLSLLQL